MPLQLNDVDSARLLPLVQNWNWLKGRKGPIYRRRNVQTETCSVFDQHAGGVQRLRGLFTIAPHHTCAVDVAAVGVFALETYTCAADEHATSVRNGPGNLDRRVSEPSWLQLL